MGYKPQEEVPENNRITNTGQNLNPPEKLPADMNEKPSAINDFMFSQEESQQYH